MMRETVYWITSKWDFAAWCFRCSQIIAGDRISGDVFKCSLIPVSEAINNGAYGDTVFTPLQLAMLNAIFPTGVCDYSKPDVGLPTKPGKGRY